MEFEERDLFDYFKEWLIEVSGKKNLSNYDLVDLAYSKVFNKQRDVGIKDAEEDLYNNFEATFVKDIWDDKRNAKKIKEEEEKRNAKELERTKKRFYENLFSLPLITSRKVDMLRDKLQKENARREVPKVDFYLTNEWLILNRFAKNLLGERCMSCGVSQATADSGIEIQSDHVLPRSKHPELALDLENLQMLCRVCNHKKRNFTDEDFRKEEDIKLVKSIYTENWENIVEIYKRK